MEFFKAMELMTKENKRVRPVSWKSIDRLASIGLVGRNDHVIDLCEKTVLDDWEVFNYEEEMDKIANESLNLLKSIYPDYKNKCEMYDICKENNNCLNDDLSYKFLAYDKILEDNITFSLSHRFSDMYENIDKKNLIDYGEYAVQSLAIFQLTYRYPDFFDDVENVRKNILHKVFTDDEIQDLYINLIRKGGWN